jgi:hypothetical protein
VNHVENVYQPSLTNFLASLRNSLSLFFIFLRLLLDTGRFSLKGADNPGIIHKVTSILAKNGLSIDRLETSDEIAPHGGTLLFKMKGIAHAYEPLASGFDPNKIKKELAFLGDELNCDIGMDDLKPGTSDLNAAV